MPLPKYFAELFNEFPELQRFDLKEVIYDKFMYEIFMEEVREQIMRREMASPLSKANYWKAV